MCAGVRSSVYVSQVGNGKCETQLARTHTLTDDDVDFPMRPILKEHAWSQITHTSMYYLQAQMTRL